MPGNSNERKAEKLAAARKRLKEYQAKEKRNDEEVQHGQDNQPEVANRQNRDNEALLSESLISEFSSAFLDHTVSDALEVKEPLTETNDNNESTPLGNCNRSPSGDTIQILIAEKANLSSALNKFRNICRERELENEELQAQFQMTSKRLEDMKKDYLLQLQSLKELKADNLTLQVQMQNQKSIYDDQAEHLEETKNLLANERTENQLLRKDLKDVQNELELTKIRINQISDESNISKDNRVESLTQVQFMHEQQIRDLQAMVQQLTRDKEQANQQYQTYVQHLNAEITKLNDKNMELSEECSKQQDRDNQYVQHISSLEKEIQKSKSLQEKQKEMQEDEANVNYIKEIENLNAKLLEFESGRYEFQLKIKSQEDRANALNINILERDNKISEMQEHIQNILSEQPDNVKLLATMESNKVAASRAVLQNEALKKQLDELEIKFVQLTNDKADLVNKLDAEEFNNREIRNNFFSLKKEIEELNDKLHFKDEEMIRLTHENNDLTTQNSVLRQQMDDLQSYEMHYYSEKYDAAQEDSHDNESDLGHLNHGHDQNSQDADDVRLNTLKHSDVYSGQKDSPLSTSPNQHDHITERNQLPSPDSSQYDSNPRKHRYEPPSIPTMEALQKLQSRFSKLMVQVADLSEEKQRLEHLVLQLQGETETIGEYIALYQTQRRVLKQREYEKAAQLQFLIEEREEMREKINALNQLVSNLGLELPNNLQLNENLKKTMDKMCIEPNVPDHTANGVEPDTHKTLIDEAPTDKHLTSDKSKEMLAKIQSIITEIRENTKELPSANAVDHLTCCSGKFEIV